MIIKKPADNDILNIEEDPTNPSYYKNGSIECIDAIESATKDLDGFEGVCVGNAMKYIWRCKEKNGTIDISKAIWYLNKLYEYENKKGEQ